MVPSQVSSTCCCHTCVAQPELCVLWSVLLLVRLASPLPSSQQTKSVCVRNNGSTLEGIVSGQRVASALAGSAVVFGSSSFSQSSLLWSFPFCFRLKFQPIGVQICKASSLRGVMLLFCWRTAFKCVSVCVVLSMQAGQTDTTMGHKSSVRQL